MDKSVKSRELRMIKPNFLKLVLVTFEVWLLKESLQTKVTPRSQKVVEQGTFFIV